MVRVLRKAGFRRATRRTGPPGGLVVPIPFYGHIPAPAGLSLYHPERFEMDSARFLAPHPCLAAACSKGGRPGPPDGAPTGDSRPSGRVAPSLPQCTGGPGAGHGARTLEPRRPSPGPPAEARGSAGPTRRDAIPVLEYQRDRRGDKRKPAL